MLPKKIYLTAAISLALGLSACSTNHNSEDPAEQTTEAADTISTQPAPGAEEGVSQEDAAAALAQIFEDYFTESLELSPIQGTFLGMREFNGVPIPNFLTAEYRQKSHNFNQKWLDEILAFDRSSLSAQDQISYDMFVYQQRQALDGERFPGHLIPINQMFNMPSFMASMGSGQSAQPFANTEDYDNWLNRAKSLPVITDQMVANMREGMEQGYVQPTVVMEKVLPQLSAHVVDSVEESIFWQPITNMPEAIAAEDKTRLENEYRNLIGTQLIPAYTRLHDFIRDEYLPATRSTVGLSAQPGGEDWYNYNIQTQTTTDLTAEEIHQFGLDEVARITSEMNDVRIAVEFEGDMEAFFTWLSEDDQFYFAEEEDLLQGYRDLQSKVNELLPTLFDIAPKADYEVRAVEAFRAQSAAGASYQRGTPDGSRPGVFYVNTYNLKAQPKFGMETLSLHEASPGHHFQISIQQEIQNMPAFRRFGGYTAFAEGWALYAESIGKEMGMFSDPFQYFGRLSDEMLRAMRLVVDTGLHAKGWTREQAIQYMLDHSTMAESDVIAEVERYIAIPGQALAYKVGQRIISELRAEAEAAMGDDFDIRAFHRLVLTGGSMPMATLQQRVRAWIAEQTS